MEADGNRQTIESVVFRQGYNMNFQEEYKKARKETLQRFGKLLREKRLAQGYKTGLQFARKVSETYPVSSQYLSQIESGSGNARREPVIPSSKVLDAISQALEWPRSEIDEALRGVNDDDVQLRLGAYITRMVGEFKDEELEDFIALLRRARQQVN